MRDRGVRVLRQTRRPEKALRVGACPLPNTGQLSIRPTEASGALTPFEPALALAEMEAPCAARANVALQYHAGQRSSSASLRSIAYPAAFVAVGTGDACGCKYEYELKQKPIYALPFLR